MNGIRSKISTAFWTTLLQLPILLLVAYTTANYTVSTERKEQEKYEQAYVKKLKESLRSQTRSNARNIRKWIPKLVIVAQNLQNFVNNKSDDRPGANPGYGSLMVTAYQGLIDNPKASRYILPCLYTALTAMRDRLGEANYVKREVDAALVQYTGTFPRPLSEAYAAAARLHARIEQLLSIYAKMPSQLGMLERVIDVQSCDEEIEINESS